MCVCVCVCIFQSCVVLCCVLLCCVVLRCVVLCPHQYLEADHLGHERHYNNSIFLHDRVGSEAHSMPFFTSSQACQSVCGGQSVVGCLWSAVCGGHSAVVSLWLAVSRVLPFCHAPLKHLYLLTPIHTLTCEYKLRMGDGRAYSLLIYIVDILSTLT